MFQAERPTPATSPHARSVIARLLAVPAFFVVRTLAGLLLLKLSTSRLPVAGFTAFSQFTLLAGLLNQAAVAGAQNGVVRQAAAAEDEAALSRVQGTAFLIWLVVAPLVAIGIAMASGRIAHLLVGTDRAWPVVIAVSLVTLGAGPGQIWSSILSGRKRVIASLSTQAAGLLAGTAAAAWLIAAGQPYAGVIGFAAGALVTAIAAFFCARGLGMGPVPLATARAGLPALLSYSAAFAATASFSAILLFALRAHYRAQFGTAALGYWLVANRISDMSTQLLGLFMIQFLVPHLAMLETKAERRALIWRCWAVGVAVMGAIPIVFALVAPLVVHLFLSDTYLPAIPAIRTYMIGDAFRVWASIAMFASFARGRPALCAGIEMSTLSLMAVITLALSAAGDPRAPLLGYCGAYAMTAVISSVVFLRAGPSRRRDASAHAARHTVRRT
jgi:O-antigen/teichoic acid export membrane protein